MVTKYRDPQSDIMQRMRDFGYSALNWTSPSNLTLQISRNTIEERQKEYKSQRDGKHQKNKAL